VCAHLCYVVLKQRAKAQVHHFSRSLKKLGRSVGRKNWWSIAQQCMNDSKIKKCRIQITRQHVCKEMKAMAGLSSISLLQNFTPERLQSFQWEDPS